jgi:hypothetical protein
MCSIAVALVATAGVESATGTDAGAAAGAAAGTAAEGRAPDLRPRNGITSTEAHNFRLPKWLVGKRVDLRFSSHLRPRGRNLPRLPFLVGFPSHLGRLFPRYRRSGQWIYIHHFYAK